MKTELGRRTMVCRLHSSISDTLRRVFTPSPNSEPIRNRSFSTAARPPGFSRRIMRARNRSAVSLVRKCCGRLLSMPSSSLPPNGGFVSTMSTRSFCSQLMYGRTQRVVVADEARVLDAVEQHVRDAKHVRQGLLFDCAQGCLHLLFVFRLFHVTLAHVIERTGVKKPPVRRRRGQTGFRPDADRCGRP